ncbi:hypothetical protein AGMMS49944_15740 [Spirochaetia bacterium]|nr:hypothetical protein AGMMS49944_15740 [Spirochaetia bacterium]
MDDQTELEIQENKKPGAKQISLAAQIVSCVWIAGNTVLKGLGISKLEMTDIIYSGIAIAAIFTPVYFSIFLDKIKDIRLGGK